MRIPRLPLTILVIVLALALAQIHILSADTTPLATLAASMAAGSWAPLATNNINPTLVDSGANGNALIYTDDITYDPVSKKFFYLGGDHNALSIFASYDSVTNTWQKLPRPSWMPSPSGYLNGTMHAYNHSAVDGVRGYFYHRPWNTFDVHRYNIATQTWDSPAVPTRPTTPPFGNYPNCCDALEYFPELGGLVWVAGDGGSPNTGHVYLLSDSTNQWTVLSGSVDLAGTWQSAKYNPVYHVLVFYSATTNKFYKLDSSRNITTIANPPFSMYDGSGYVTALTVDPVGGQYLALSSSSRQLYTYDVPSNTWRTQTSTNKPDFSSQAVVATPVSSYGVTFFTACRSAGAGCQAYVYKHQASTPPPADSTPPAVSMSAPTAGSTSSGMATVSANASDNVGVAGVQFKLDGNNLGAEDTASPYSVSWNTASATNASHSLTAVARDAASNQTTSSSISVTANNAAPPPDTTPPAVSMSAPASGSTSATVTVSANASDNVAVAGVQFKLDGNNLGAEDTASPYSVSWNTTTATNASHSLTAAARDAAGNQTSSSSISVTVDNGAPPSGSDFTNRCTAAGVIRCFAFDSPSDFNTGTGGMNGAYGQNYGILAPYGTSDYTKTARDTTVSADGGSSLRFTISSNSGSDMAGSWFANFSPDLSTQFGGNSEFYVQYRQRFSPELLATNYAGGGGWKQDIIGTGDKAGKVYSSCSNLETVLQNTYQRGFAQMYNSCTGSASHGAYNGFEEAFGASDFKLQNAMPAQYCLYSGNWSLGTARSNPPGNCFTYVPNEWMTFQIHIKTGPRVNDEFTNSHVDLWIARDGQPSQQVINWGPYNLSAGSASEDQKFGKIWLLPYHTGKDSSQVTPTAYTWYDDLIISRNKIADPGAASPLPVDTTSPVLSSIAASAITGSGGTIGWTSNEAADSQVEYGQTTAYGSQTTLNSAPVTSHSQALSGLTAGTTYNYRVKSRDASGNLATSPNATFTTSTSVDTTPPALSSTAASGITSSGGTISWTTNEAADSQVEYGQTTAYGSQTTLNSALVTSHSQALSGLTAETTYNYRVKSRDAAGNLATSPNATFTTSTSVDTTPPVLSSIAASGIATSGAMINWTTSEAANGQVNYGTTTSYGQSTTMVASLTTAHFVNLSGMSPSTTYHFRVNSTDAAGNLATSGDSVFTTTVSGGTTANINFQTPGAVAYPGYLVDDGSLYGVRGAAYSYGWNAPMATEPRVRNSPLSPDPRYDTLIHMGNAVWEMAVPNGTYTVHVAVGDPKYADVVSKLTVEGVSAIIGNTSDPNRWLENTVTVPVTDGRLTVGNLAGSYNKICYINVTGPFGSAPDTTPPLLSGIAASGITSSGAMINWTTNEVADTQVEYGLTSGYGQTTAVNASLVTGHSVTLSGLSSGTTYNYRVRSSDAAGNLATSSNVTVTTAAVFDFSVSLSSGGSVTAGQSVAYTVTAGLTSGTSESVTLSSSGMPSGTTATFSPSSCSPGCPSTLTLLTAAATPPGSYAITVTGASSSVSHSVPFTLTVIAAAPGGTINIYPGTDVFGPAAQNLVAGNTLIVHQGTYFETSRMSLQASGTAAAPILITGAPGETIPVITRPAAASVQNTINIEGSARYLTIRGLEVAGNGGDGVNMSGNLSFITLQDLVIHDIDVGINFRSNMNNITVRHNHIYNTGIDGGTGEGMYVGCNDAGCIVQNSLIEGNWIHDVLPGTTQGDGIEVKVGSHSNIVRDNVIYNRTYPGIFVYGTGGNPVNVVEGNVIWNALEGIYAVADAIVRNNIVFNSGTGLSLYGHTQVGQMKNVTAVNNTLYNNAEGVYMRWSSGASNMILANNAIYSPDGTALNLSGSVGTFAANYVTGATDRTLNGNEFINGGTAASTFVDPLNMNLWLKPGSLLIGKANNVYVPTVDFNSASRISPQDVGAYETNGAASNPGWTMSAGFKSTPPPGPPADTTAPAISNITASGLTTTGAVINWTTNEPADSQVEYGVATAYGNQTTADSWLLTSHSQTLSGLLPGTVYNYRVKSRDAAVNLGVSNNLTFTTVSGTPPPVVPDPTLTGSWTFNEGAGAGTYDASGNNNNGTLVRNPVWTPGVIGQALQFNATDNGNDNDDPQVLIGRNFDVAALPFTLTAWINPVNFSDWRAIFSKRDTFSNGGMRFDIGLSQGTGRAYVSTNKSSRVFSFAPAPNTWTHIALVVSATETKLYFNGVLKQTVGGVILGTSATANTVIGGTGEGAGGDNDPFKGMIDEVRVYTRALAASEVQTIYQLR